VRSGVHGFSLRDVGSLADSGGLAHRLIHRAPGQSIPVPSVVHWKVDHYAAITSEEKSLYHIKDPTFGGDLFVSRKAIDEEASGYFLVPEGGATDPAWSKVSAEELDRVHAMGFTSGSADGAVSPDDKKIRGNCGSHGMCIPDVHAMEVSLKLNDTPVGYSPQKGPPVNITLTYNNRGSRDMVGRADAVTDAAVGCS
jgi:hypothetical protein